MAQLGLNFSYHLMPRPGFKPTSVELHRTSGTFRRTLYWLGSIKALMALAQILQLKPKLTSLTFSGWTELPDGTMIRKASSWASWSAASSSDDEFDDGYLVSWRRSQSIQDAINQSYSLHLVIVYYILKHKTGLNWCGLWFEPMSMKLVNPQAQYIF